jgi:hypothetical protein
MQHLVRGDLEVRARRRAEIRALEPHGRGRWHLGDRREGARARAMQRAGHLRSHLGDHQIELVPASGEDVVHRRLHAQHDRLEVRARRGVHHVLNGLGEALAGQRLLERDIGRAARSRVGVGCAGAQHLLDLGDLAVVEHVVELVGAGDVDLLRHQRVADLRARGKHPAGGLGVEAHLRAGLASDRLGVQLDEPRLATAGLLAGDGTFDRVGLGEQRLAALQLRERRAEIRVGHTVTHHSA